MRKDTLVQPLYERESDGARGHTFQGFIHKRCKRLWDSMRFTLGGHRRHRMQNPKTLNRLWRPMCKILRKSERIRSVYGLVG